MRKYGTLNLPPVLPIIIYILHCSVIVVVDYIFLIHLETTTALCVPQKSRLKVEKRRRRKKKGCVHNQPISICHLPCREIYKGAGKEKFYYLLWLYSVEVGMYGLGTVHLRCASAKRILNSRPSPGIKYVVRSWPSFRPICYVVSM